MDERCGVRRGSKTGVAARVQRACAWLGLCIACVAAAPADACERTAVKFDLPRCEPYARVVWMPPEAAGDMGGVRYALGLARLNRTGLTLTGHDPGETAVVPVLSMRSAAAVRLALMPTWRNGDVGVAVIASLPLGR